MQAAKNWYDEKSEKTWINWYDEKSEKNLNLDGIGLSRPQSLIVRISCVTCSKANLSVNQLAVAAVAVLIVYSVDINHRC
jgi:hypothetical protein